MIKVVLPRTMMVSKIEGENDIEDLYVGHPVEELINRNCTNNMVVYLDDIPGTLYALNEDHEHHEFMKEYSKIMEWTDQPRSRYINDPEYDEDREYHEFMKKYGQVMEQLKSYKIPEARAALIITQVIAIHEGCEER